MGLKKILDPFILGGHNFLIFHPFPMILSVLDALKEGLQILFKHRKQWNPPQTNIR
jgi:hypothetical protein